MHSLAVVARSSGRSWARSRAQAGGSGRDYLIGSVFSARSEPADHGSHGDGVARLGTGGQDVQRARVQALDLLDGLVAFEAEKRLAGLDEVSRRP